ncbi:MAG: S1 RNA-binding domain-containing protein [Candidatus Micrarchaeaceae archaeon]
MPDEGELVIIRIEKVMKFGAYCKLLEYNIDAYLPIAEVSSGWIKNIHEFIKEGQTHIAKVIFSDKTKKAVDVSLKRVSQREKKEKSEEYEIENKSEKLFEQALTQIGEKDKKSYYANLLSKKYSYYYEVIDAVTKGEDVFSKKAPSLLQALKDLASKSIKPKMYEVQYKLKISSNSGNGIYDIKKILTEIGKEGIEVIYTGAPNYLLKAQGPSYEDAERTVRKAVENAEKEAKEKKMELSITK